MLDGNFYAWWKTLGTNCWGNSKYLGIFMHVAQRWHNTFQRQPKYYSLSNVWENHIQKKIEFYKYLGIFMHWGMYVFIIIMSKIFFRLKSKTRAWSPWRGEEEKIPMFFLGFTTPTIFYLVKYWPDFFKFLNWNLFDWHFDSLWRVNKGINNDNSHFSGTLLKIIYLFAKGFWRNLQ